MSEDNPDQNSKKSIPEQTSSGSEYYTKDANDVI